MAEQENILTRLGKLFQNQIVLRKTPEGQIKVKDVDFTQTALTSTLSSLLPIVDYFYLFVISMQYL